MKPSRLFAIAVLAAASTLAAGCSRCSSSPSLGRPEPPPSDFYARFMGISTILFADGTNAVMTDGYFSRPEIARVAGALPRLEGFFDASKPNKLRFLAIKPNHKRINAALARAGVDQLDALFAAHSHFDHAMDTAEVAKKTGAVVYGSESVANLARGAGLSEARIRTIADRDSFEFGAMKVKAIESPHSPKPLFDGDISTPRPLPASILDLKVGKNFSFLVERNGRRILVHPSAGYKAYKMASVKADIVFLGIGLLAKQGKEYAREYWKEVVEATGARVVYLVHWDNPFEPLGETLKFKSLIIDDVEQAAAWLRPLAAAQGVSLRIPKLYEPIDLTGGPAAAAASD